VVGRFPNRNIAARKIATARRASQGCPQMFRFVCRSRTALKQEQFFEVLS
jgi:hypothetical protein